MITNPKELSKCLNILKEGMDKNSRVSHHRYIFFTKDGMMTFNDDIFVFTPLNTGIKKDEIFAVEDNFLKISNKLKGKTIDIEFCDDNISIKTKNDDIKIAAIRNIKIENVPKIPDNFIEIPIELIEAINLCKISTLKESDPEKFTCIWGSKDIISSSDGARVSSYKLGEKLNDDFMFYAGNVPLISTLNPCEYFVDESWIYFKNENGSVISLCQFRFDEIDDVSKHFEIDEDEINEVAFPKESIEALQKAHVFAEQELDTDMYVNIEITGDEIIFSSKSEKGEIITKIDFENEDDVEISFNVNPEYLMGILKEEDIVKISEGMIYVLAGGFKHAIALCE